MVIRNKKKTLLNTLNEWKKGFIEVDKKTHWSEGYSAYSLGLFFTSGNGERWLSGLEKALFGCELEHMDAEIEHASKLDSYKGGQRMQDLAIWGKTLDGRTCFVGIEAKVLEPFGELSVYDSYIAGLDERENRNPNSKKANRVCEVVDFLFRGKTPSDEGIRNLRYQLMHYFKASILEAPSLKESAKSIKSSRGLADIIVLPVLVFNTDHYKTNPGLAKDNYDDYLSFVTALGCVKSRYGEHDVYHTVIDGRDVFSVYEVVEP